MFKNYKTLPGELILSLTNSCNLRCDYCFQCKKEPKFMSKEVVEQSIDFIMSDDKSGLNFKTINLYGGEPTLNLDAIEYAIDRYIYCRDVLGKPTILYFYMNTNGTIMNDRFINIIKKIKSVTSFRYIVSLNGDEIGHDTTRKDINGNGTHKLIIDNLNKLKKAIPDIYIEAHAVIDRKFIERFYENSKYLLTNNLFNRVSSELIFYGTSEEYTKSDIEKMCDVYTQLKKELPNADMEYFFDCLLTVNNHRNICKNTPNFCIPGRYIACVDYKGDLLPCDFYLNLEYYSKYTIGNIYGDYKTYNSKIDEYQKLLDEVITNENVYLKNDRIQCDKICDCGTACDICYALVDILSSGFNIPKGMCERTKLMCEVFREKKFIK